MIKIVMPQMGESLAEGTVVRWLKRPGDSIARDEPLFEISTDKVDTDVPSPVEGVLRTIMVPEGQTVAVGTAVALVEVDEVRELQTPAAGSATVPKGAAATEEAEGHFKSSHAPQLVLFRHGAPQAAQAALSATPSVSERPPGASRFRPTGVGVEPTRDTRSNLYSPAVLNAARAGRIPLDELTAMNGSGRGGRITKRDVERFLASGPAPAGIPSSAPARQTVAPAAQELSRAMPPEYLYRPTAEDQIVPMSPVRRKIAHHMSWSARISPHASASVDVDMTYAADVVTRERERFAERHGAPLTYTVLSAEALVATLRDFPVLNASVLDDVLVLKPRIHLGVAVALKDSDELIVPVVKDADGLSLAGLARAVADLAGRARDRLLRPEDVQGGTFTLTNPGVFGGITGTPLLNQPQVGIIGLGAITKRAVVVGDDRIAVKPMMTMSLTFDHRATDGMTAFRFLGRLRERLEHGPREL